MIGEPTSTGTRRDPRQGAGSGIRRLALRRLLLIVALLVAIAAASVAQSRDAVSAPKVAGEGGPSLLQLAFEPAVAIPVFPDATVFNPGVTGNLKALVTLPFLPFVFIGGDASYTFAPLRRNDTLSLVWGGLEAGLWLQVVPGILTLKAYGGGGYYVAALNSGAGTGSNPVVMGGLGLSVNLTPALSLGVSGAYRRFFGLYNDIAVAVGTSLHLGGSVGPVVQRQAPQARPAPLSTQQDETAQPGTGLEMSTISFWDIYPVFYKFYDDHPVGTAQLHNGEKTPVQNVKVSVLVKEYMDNPKETKGPERMEPGADAAVDLYALLKKDILSNTEDTKVSASISLEYSVGGKTVTRSYVQTVSVLKRNSLTWDDDRKAAAFVSPNDPTAVRFAKNVASVVSGKGNTAVDQSLRLAAAIHDALTLYSLTYSADPVATLNSANQTVDYIQFPQQTLDYRSGKCSDFSVLYASMFEALAIETAFITIPGHIYVAFALGLTPDEARASFTHEDDLIITDDKVWVPLEITLREGGFVKAWQLGAKEWRENLARKQAVLYPLREAWKVYAPVGFASAASDIRIPPEDRILLVFTGDLDGFVMGEIGQQQSVLQAAVGRAGSTAAFAKSLNSLAILHSRYGMYDQAVHEYEQVLAKDEYVPALVNLGNIYFIRGDNEKALEYYDRAGKKAPTNTVVLLGIARANHALENYSLAKKAYVALQSADPDLASRFAYLDLRGEEATRAANAAGSRTATVWQQDP